MWHEKEQNLRGSRHVRRRGTKCVSTAHHRQSGSVESALQEKALFSRVLVQCCYDGSVFCRVITPVDVFILYAVTVDPFCRFVLARCNLGVRLRFRRILCAARIRSWLLTALRRKTPPQGWLSRVYPQTEAIFFPTTHGLLYSFLFRTLSFFLHLSTRSLCSYACSAS